MRQCLVIGGRFLDEDPDVAVNVIGDRLRLKVHRGTLVMGHWCIAGRAAHQASAVVCRRIFFAAIRGPRFLSQSQTPVMQ